MVWKNLDIHMLDIVLEELEQVITKHDVDKIVISPVICSAWGKAIHITEILKNNLKYQGEE